MTKAELNDYDKRSRELKKVYPCEGEASECACYPWCANCFRRALQLDPGGFSDRQLRVMGDVYTTMLEAAKRAGQKRKGV